MFVVHKLSILLAGFWIVAALLSPAVADEDARAVQRSQLTLHLNSSSSPARAAAYLSWLNVEF